MKRNILRSNAPILITLAVFTIASIHNSHLHPQKVVFGSSFAADTVQKVVKTGNELYLQACSTCHGHTGQATVQSQLGFATPPPDFTDCNFATREPDTDWIAVAHQGGPVRGFSTDMPAFGTALSTEQLQKIMDHIRPLVTEKAYREDEAVFSTSVDMENEGAVMNELVYEQRFGARSQLEIVVPFGFTETAAGNWRGDQLGDVALGVKREMYHNVNSGTILRLTGEFLLPTGDVATGYGKGTTIFEPFLSFGQILPAGSFLHVQSGMELPLIRDKAAMRRSGVRP